MLKLLLAAARPAVSISRRSAALPPLRPAGRPQSPPAPPGLAAVPLLEAAGLPLPELLARYDTTAAGLPPAKAADRLALFGPNEVGHERPPAWYVQLLAGFKNPFIVVLLVLALVSFCTGDTKAVLVITSMVTLSVLISFSQEYRSRRTTEKLKALVHTTASVLRPATGHLGPAGPLPVPLRELVPGDVVHLAAGDLVPADVRLLAAKDLLVAQSALTGEALPVEKSAAAPVALAGAVLELPQLCLLGTTVVSGTAHGLVLATGGCTYFGQLASSLVGQRPRTSFDRGLNGVSWVLIRFMLVLVPVVFFLNGFTKHDWGAAFFFALSVAVGLTPEMLPVVVSANLAKGARRLARQKVVVKKLAAIQNFGAMDVLCTDKTGTLTDDNIVLLKHLDVYGQPDSAVLAYARLNSQHQTGLRNLLDAAVLAHPAQDSAFRTAYAKVDEIPFDFDRRRLSVVLAELAGGHLLICKGAPEELLRQCTRAVSYGEVLPLEPALLAQANALIRSMNEDGLRVVAVATRTLEARTAPYTPADEVGLTLVGLLGFLDPPKASTAAALAALHQRGVAVKVLTGDSEISTRRVCREVGLPVAGVLLGSELDALNDSELQAAAETHTIFARLNPLQKARLVGQLQAAGRTVGFLGDGINDAPALRAADVGISVDTAVDIAKEAADIILLEKSLLVLSEGVQEGRRTFGNTIKYIKMTASSNFGNVFSVLGASAFLPFLPMLPLHLLVQNLCYDVSQLAIPWDTLDADYLARPRRWDAGSVGRFMLCIGPISSVFDYATFLLMYFVFRANVPAAQALFQSGWFVEGLLSQTLIVHMIRTERIPFFQSTASWPVLVLTGLIVLAGLGLPFLPLGHFLGLVPLPPAYFGWLMGFLLGYAALTQLVKGWYIRRFGDWL
jgi:Mg2+-importing ATPase